MEKAQTILLDRITLVGECTVSLLDACGKGLSQDIKASTNMAYWGNAFAKYRIISDRP